MVDAVLVDQLVNGLAAGLAYVLIAAGYQLTFSVLRIANLAYGAVFMLGAMCALRVYNFTGSSAVAVIAGAIASIALGLAVHAIAVMPLGRVERVDSPEHIAVLGSTFGASFLIEYTVVAWVGAYPQSFPVLIRGPAMKWGALNVSSTLSASLAISIAVLLLLIWLLARTYFGLRLRAITANAELAASVGVRTARDQLLCVALSSALAGMAGILVSQQIGAVSPAIGVSYGLKALAALIVGRTALGTAAVALLLGLAETLVVAYVTSESRDLVVYGALLVVIVVRARVWERRIA